ncbi:MAG: DNA adenine methylase [Deltaproteobacteria bacterium]|nr:DNA adenine methylase [Deltaproteobacteria bacterium]MDL1962092.1 DNA adenine methylase [Deltaproteobacteria bacterium]
MKRNRLKKPRKVDASATGTGHVVHINRQIPPLAHTSIYLWHKYWSRKTWNVVGKYIKAYCPEGGIVFDPFAGSGITAMEALKNGRKAIVCDLVPIATEITRLTIKPVNEVHLYEAYKRVEEKVRDKIKDLYLTKCRKCRKEIVFDCAIWKGDQCLEIRYQSCPHCGDRQEKDCKLAGYDKDLLQKIEKKSIKEWYPTNPFYYPDGRPFKEKQQYESVDELFTKRNLQALAWLIEAIEEEPKRDLRDFLKIGFSSMTHLCTKMMPVRPTRPFSSVWNEHSYWSADVFMELNVWDRFENTISGRQGLLKAKAESNKIFKDFKIASSFKQVLSGKANVYIYNGSCLDLMQKIPEGAVDYIFTDPPYDASIQFGELSYMWVSWLKMNTDYIEKLVANEIVRNERQHKDFNSYYALLSNSFQKMFNVLKPEHYLTLTFHNPTFKVRNATIRAGVFAGFEFQKVHHQELARPSAKSLLQPFGAAQGDFYLRFNKPKSAVSKPEEIDEVRFENIVVETTIALLAERAEPTPYTIIINYIDPVLAKHGYFGSLRTGLDINTVLKKHVDKEFVLLHAKLGGAEGKLWWFKDTSIVPRLNEIPLTERVEQTIYRKLYQRGRVTFTEIWDAVSTEFPNSLTSDSTSIKDALNIYARKVSGGYWLLKPEIQQRVNQHSEIIAILAIIGNEKGHDIWIGKREQRERDSGLVSKGKTLKEYMTLKQLKVDNASNQSVIENIDLIWIKGKEIKAIFEVESTTTMTSALMRGSNVYQRVDKFMVLPEEREGQLRNKLTSPLFKDHFENENWQLIYFDTLRDAYVKQKAKTDIYSLINKKTGTSKNRAVSSTHIQRQLF